MNIKNSALAYKTRCGVQVPLTDVCGGSHRRNVQAVDCHDEFEARGVHLRGLFRLSKFSLDSERGMAQCSDLSYFFFPSPP